MNHTHRSSREDTRGTLIALLGADFRSAIVPFKLEIQTLAAELSCDHLQAGLQLLARRQALRGPELEQQLILAALQELQESELQASGPARKIS